MEAHGFQTWLVNAKDVKNLPGRPKTDRLDAVWLCKVAERQMLRPSFVPPVPIRRLRDLTRYRIALVSDQGREKNRVEKLLEDALLTELSEIRRVICSTNAIESLNARYRRAVKARGHFPTEQAAMKCLYLVTRSLDPKGTGQTRWAVRWKPALNAFAITFADRMPAAEDR